MPDNVTKDIPDITDGEESVEGLDDAALDQESPGSDEAENSKKHGRSALSVIAGVAIAILLVAGVIVRLSEMNVYYIAAVSFDRQSAGMFTGERLEITPELTFFGSGEPELMWTSSSPDVASVDENGAVIALSAGQTSITATEPITGRQAQCAVSVYSLDQMILGFTEMTLGAGEDITLSVQTGTAETAAPVYTSSDPSVAEVDETGSITAIGKGTATVTVSSRGFSDAVCQVTVMDAPTVMETDISGEMCVGETRQMTVSMSDLEYSSAMEFASDDTSVVTVDSEGIIRAVSKGTATVTVRAHNNVSCQLPVTVGDEPSSVTVAKKVTAYNGLPLYLEVSDDTGVCREFYYTSSDPEVLQVGEDGAIHALMPGSATVTCTSYNGKSAECRVTAKIVDSTTPYVSGVVYENIAAMAAAYPDIISTRSIGTSVQGRDITLLTLGTGEKKVLVVAGMHSREGIAVSFTMRCIEEYAEAMTKGEKYCGYNVKKLLSEYTIYFVPLMNPDGMDIYMGIEQPEYTDVPLSEEELSEYKNNANGVNLNRNAPFVWGQAGVNVTEPDGRSYAGASAASEPETQAIIDLCTANEFEWMFNMHCKGHLAYYQDKVNDVTEQASNIARRLYDKYGFELTDRSTEYEISGGLENWFRSEYGRAGICVELVESKYSVAVNEYFESKVHWNETRGLFLACLGE